MQNTQLLYGIPKLAYNCTLFTVSAQVFFFLPMGKVSGPEKRKTLGLTHWWQTPGKNLPDLSQIFPQVEKHMSCSTNNEGLLIYISYAKICKSCLNKLRYWKWGRSGPLIRTGWDGNPWNIPSTLLLPNFRIANFCFYYVCFFTHYLPGSPLTE